MDEVSRTDFGVTFDGPALAGGEMPIRDLAPALLALGDVFVAASRIVEPDKPPAALSIRATREGSFSVDLLLGGQHVWNQIVDLLSSDGATAIVNLKEAIIGAGGLFAFLLSVRSRRITNTEHIDAGRVKITFDDETTLEVPPETLELYGSIEIRRKVREVVAPLGRDGVESLSFTSESTATVSVHARDLGAFSLPTSNDLVLTDQTVEMVVTIVSVTFTEGKWRLTDGDKTFSAEIEDEDFLFRVDASAESFRKGDMLRTKMRVVQTRKNKAIRVDHYLVEVIEHIDAPQLTLGQGDGPAT
jgi:hypothetical protein